MVTYNEKSGILNVKGGEIMPTPESVKKAVAKYQARFDDIKLHIPQGSKERWKAQAAAQGKSLTAYIIELVEADMKKSKD